MIIDKKQFLYPPFNKNSILYKFLKSEKITKNFSSEIKKHYGISLSVEYGRIKKRYELNLKNLEVNKSYDYKSKDHLLNFLNHENKIKTKIFLSGWNDLVLNREYYFSLSENKNPRKPIKSLPDIIESNIISFVESSISLSKNITFYQYLLQKEPNDSTQMSSHYYLYDKHMKREAVPKKEDLKLKNLIHEFVSPIFITNKNDFKYFSESELLGQEEYVKKHAKEWKLQENIQFNQEFAKLLKTLIK